MTQFFYNHLSDHSYLALIERMSQSNLSKLVMTGIIIDLNSGGYLTSSYCSNIETIPEH